MNTEPFTDLLTQFYEFCADGIIFMDDQGLVRFINPAGLSLLGYEEDNLIGCSIDLLIPEANRPDHTFLRHGYLKEPLARTMGRRLKVNACQKNGDLLPVDIRLCPLSYEGRIWVAVLLQDAKEERSVHDKLYFLAHHDRLTGLMNVDAFLDALNQQIASPESAFVTILLIDIDNFKSINDTFGHAQGDQFLLAFSKRLKQLLAPEDFLARIGGDEFVCMSSRFCANSDIQIMAAQLLSELALPFDVNRIQISTSVSIGISTFPSTSLEGQGLLAEADEAMYYVKKRGKNNMAFYQVVLQELANKAPA